MNLPNKLSRIVRWCLAYNIIISDSVLLVLLRPSPKYQKPGLPCHAIYPAKCKQILVSLNSNLQCLNINLCCNADLQIDAIKFYVDSFLNRLINISIPRLFVIIFIICFGDQNDHAKSSGDHLLMVCHQNPIQEMSTNSPLLLLPSSVPCQFNKEHATGQASKCPRRQLRTALTAAAATELIHGPWMGKPNIAIRCYISQFTYNLQNLLFLPDRFFRWSPAKKCCRYTSLSVSVSPRARSIYLIFFSCCCCCCGCCVSRDSPAMMSTRDTIHLLHASPSRDLMPPVAVSLSLCCAVRTLEKCHEFHTSAFRSTWPTRFFEGVTSALSPVSDLRRYWYYYYVPLRWSITTGQDNRAHEALLLLLLVMLSQFVIVSRVGSLGSGEDEYAGN